MRIFVFEFTTGGGLFDEAGAHIRSGLAGCHVHASMDMPAMDESHDSSLHTHDKREHGTRASGDLAALAREGRAMVTALADDFAALADVQVQILRDCRWSAPDSPIVRIRQVESAAEFRAAFDDETAKADFTVVIAPECGGVLLECAERALVCGGKLLGPSPDVVRLTSDKHATAEHLARHGVPVPMGRLLAPGESWPADLCPPLVRKPRDGAGSQGVRLIESPLAEKELPLAAGGWRVETYYPGTPASVAVLCGLAGCVALKPCVQRLSQDGRFRYLGGSLPLDPPLAERAADLATRAIGALPSTLGYLGVDLILGDCPSGRDDVVIEINPRLTTSYIGLRAYVRGNLAQAMLDVAAGRAPSLSAGERRVEFDADGSLRISADESARSKLRR